MIRFENTHTGRVVEYAEPEEINPPDRTYPSGNDKAMAQRDAGRRERLLKSMRNSRRWRTTTKPITRQTELQREQERRQDERRRIEAQVRAEYEQKLATERAKWERENAATEQPPSDSAETGDGDGGAQPQAQQQEEVSAAAEKQPTTKKKGPEPSRAQVRAWAEDQGYTGLPSRGALPEDVVAAYKAEHPDT